MGLDLNTVKTIIATYGVSVDLKKISIRVEETTQSYIVQIAENERILFITEVVKQFSYGT